jgi:NAD(P)H-hydrate epimerase
VIPFAISALAKAGTGDVLAGTIAGLRAQGVKAYQAAVLGAFLHGSAAELAVEALGGEEGILASEVADYLANAIAKVRAGTIGKRRG